MKKSKFNLTHLHSTTLDPGYLVPFLLIPTLPNDSFRIGLSTFIRAQPMLAPLMHEVRLFTQYWFVPNRLLWQDWEEFITGGQDLTSTPAFPTITLDADDAKVGSLTDYFGFPTVEGIEVSALPYRAMAMIWNERYRDEDLQEFVPLDIGSGEDTTTSRKLLSPSFAKDYFTIARPFTQRGGEVVVPVYENQGGSGQVSALNLNYRVLVLVMNPSDTSNGSFGFSFGAHPTGGIFGEVTPDGLTPDQLTNAVQSWITAHVSDWDTLLSDAENPMLFTPAFLDPRLAGTFTFVGTRYTPNDDAVSEGTYDTKQIEVRVFVLPDSSEAVMSDDPITDGFQTYGYPRTKKFMTPASDAPSNARTMIFDTSYGKFAMVNLWGTSPNNGDYSFAGNPWLNSNIGTYAVVRAASTQGFSIRDLRMSSALQRYAERSLLWGNRYEEFIQREFGIKPRDARIQRPEYLGGGRGILNISEVLQTAEAEDTGVGTMRGHGIASISQRPIRFRCPEHGIVLGLLSIRPKSVYTQGIDREWLKRSRLDFFTPELATIGMQEVLQQELYAQPDNKDKIFGYSDRYQEYRYQKPLVTGEFRDNLSFWNMARIFNNPPELTPEFIDMSYSAADFKRPFQIQDDGAHSFVVMLKNHIRAYRTVPKRAKDLLR